MNTNKREMLCDMGCEDSVVFDNPDYDDAIIGISDEGNVIYDYDLMVECLVKEDEITEEYATDFISYNTIRSIPYMPNPKPIVMYKLLE